MEVSQCRAQLTSCQQRDLVSGFHGDGCRVPDPEALLALEPRLLAAAELVATGDQLVVRRSAGPLDFDPASPLPEMAEAVQQARALALPGAAAVAPLGDAQGRSRALLWIRARPQPGLDPGPLALALLAAALLGGLGSWYLAARVWRPVRALHQVAEAALSGRQEALSSASAETEELRSSVMDLAQRVMSSGQIPPGR